MKKLFITDLDGTLLNEHETISAYTQEVLNSLRDDYVVVASGRSYAVILKLFAQINCDYIIGFNGAAIIDNRTKEFVYKCVLSDPQTITQKLYDLGFCPFIYSDDCIYIMESDNTLSNEYIRRKTDINRVMEWKFIRNVSEITSDVYKVGVYVHPEMLEVAQQVAAAEGMVFSLPDWLEINNPEANKGKAIAQFLTQHPVPYSDIYIFGDGENDLPMFSLHPEINCYAMDNANPKLKQIAKAVIGSNREDSVAKKILEIKAQESKG